MQPSHAHPRHSSPRVATCAASVFGAALLLAGLFPPAAEAHEPRQWVPWTRVENGVVVPNVCPQGGPYVDCWIEETRFQDEINDLVAGPDDSYGSSATPSHADIYSGPNNDQASFYYAWDPDAACSTKTYVPSGSPVGTTPIPYAELGSTDCQSPRGMFYVAMRLRDTPTLSGNPTPGEDVNGPFKSSVAWNFIFETNGDGFGDFILSVDGNQGTNDNCNLAGNKCYDNQVLARNTPGRGNLAQPNVQEPNQYFNEHVKQADGPDTRLCSQTNPQGDILVSHDANRFNNPPNSLKPPVPGCTSNLKGVCDFGITQTLNVNASDCLVSGLSSDGLDNDGNACNNATPPYDPTHGVQNFVLMMQTPLDWFDNCTDAISTAEWPEGTTDTIPGSQILFPDSPFSICLTTSTQPNNFTLKDLGYEGTFRMDPLKPLTCTDNCTLAGGCQQDPILADIEATCGGGLPQGTARIVAEVIDTNQVSGSNIVDSIASVQFYYAQEDDFGNLVTGYTLIGSGTNTGVVPPDIDTLINTWFRDWNYSSLPGAWYRIRTVITDDQGNTETITPIRIDTRTCSTAANPVTLADFGATRDGSKVRFDWMTATEVGNLAFNILVSDGKGGFRAINEEPIAAVGRDRVEPQRYSFEAYDLEGKDFFLEDISIQGVATMHGPFSIDGRPKQARPALGLEKIDWSSIRAASAAARAPSVRSVSRAARGGNGNGGGKAASTSIEMLVEEAGLYRVTYEELLTAGMDFAGVHAGHLAVTNRGRAVPIRVESGKTFGPGGFVEFFGETVDTLYTDTNVYVLSAEPKSAKRIGEESGLGAGAPADSYRETFRFERQREYTYATPTDDPWYDTSMVTFKGSSRQWSFDFAIDGLSSSDAAAALRVDLWGITDWAYTPDHHAVISVNGQVVADELFDGLTTRTVTSALPPGLLQDGANTLTITLPGDLQFQHDVVYLDGFQIVYPRTFTARNGQLRYSGSAGSYLVDGISGDAVAYRLADGEATRIPVTPAGGDLVSVGGTGAHAEYVVSAVSALRTPALRLGRPPVDITSGTADYLILAHEDFLGGLAPLVQAREAQGLSVKVVDVADVYAQFGHGIFGAEAIRDYIRQVAPSMGLSYVLLVGGDTYDYHDYTGVGSISFVPSPYGRTDDLISHAPVDPLYADLDGDAVQDLAIGRLPVRTRAELDVIVEKTLLYASKGYEKSALFAADVYDTGAEISYSTHSEGMARQLPSDWSVTRAYAEAGMTSSARQTLIATMNDGVALTSWLGHSGPTLWSLSRIFTATDASRLENVGDPTVVAQWGCWNTYHVTPHYNTLGHKLLLSGYQGAAAVMGSATLSSAESDLALGQLLTPHLSRQGTTIGEAMVAAKQELSATGARPLDVLLGWTLLGDPALAIDP